ncbi:hypothetical protein KM043_014083 [Ampulex compressa]|nr:hypothetical protein KM043_014083 [Ampulex compressa]
MEGWYPCNVTATPAFEIISSHQGIAITIACFHNVAMDTLVTGLITVACCQLTLLSENLASISNIDNEESIYRSRDMERGHDIVRNSKSYEALKDCIRHSNTIFDFVEEIQDIFSTVIFMQFFVNCIIICLIAFNIAQSANVLFAAYSGPWWHATESFKRSIQIIMTRAYRPLIFKAGNVMSLSLQTFVRILRMSYSTFTVLQSSTEV